HFFSPAFQFSTTFKSGADAELPAMVLSKNRFPSAVTSYPGPPGTKCASNSGWGASGSKVGFGPAVALTAAAIIFPSAPTKNNSLPSPRHRGCSPPATEILHWPSAAGNGRTYTSGWPDSSDVYAIQRLSGDSCPKCSLNSERRKETPFGTAPPS